MTPDEAESSGWYYQPILLILDDGTALCPMSDDEGNETSAICCTKQGRGRNYSSNEGENLMELSKEQMKRVIEELESSYNSKMFEDKNLEEIINLFKSYLNSGETK